MMSQQISDKIIKDALLACLEWHKNDKWRFGHYGQRLAWNIHKTRIENALLVIDNSQKGK